MTEKPLERKNWQHLAMAVTGSIVFILLGTVISIFNLSRTQWGLSCWEPAWIGILVGPMACMTIIWLLASAIPAMRKVPMAFWGLFYSLMVVSSSYSTWFYPNYTLNSVMVYRYYEPLRDLFNQYMPSLWAPTEAYVVPAYAGGAAVPWGPWTTPLVFWVVLFLASYFFSTFGALIFRRSWIDIGKMSYPFATPLIKLMDDMSPTKTGEGKSRRLLFICTLIGFLVVIPEILSLFYPWITITRGDNVSSPLLMAAGQSIDLVTLIPGFGDALPNASFKLVYGPPWLVALFAFIPLDILFSTWVFYIILNWIIAPIQTSLGWLPYDPTWTSPTRWQNANWTGTIKPAAMFEAGGMLGIAVWAIVGNWGYISETLRAVIKPNPTIEEREPIPYRWMYVGLIVTGIVVVACFVATNVPIELAIFMVIWLQLYSLSMARFRGEGGAWMYWLGNDGSAFMLYAAGWQNTLAGEELNAQAFPTMWYAEGYSMERGLSWSVGGGLSLEGLNTVAKTGASNKTAFIGQSLAVVLAILISTPLCLWAMYTYGINNVGALLSGRNSWQFLQGRLYPYVAIGRPVGGPFQHWIAGGLITVALLLVRMRFIWFPLNPMGLILGGSTQLGFGGFWWIAFEAWLIKYILIKVGGTRLYENKGVPIFTGIFVGFILAYLVEHLVNVAHYFIPW